MITEIYHKIMPDGKRYSEFIGKANDIVSVDTTNVANGSKCTIMDGGGESSVRTVCYYSEDDNDWIVEGGTLFLSTLTPIDQGEI